MLTPQDNRVMVIGPVPPPYGGWAHTVASLLRPPFTECLHLVPYDTKLRLQGEGEPKASILLRRAWSDWSGFRRAVTMSPSVAILFTGPGFSFWRDMLILRTCHRMRVPVVVRFLGGVMTQKLEALPPPLRWLVFRELGQAKVLVAETSEMVGQLGDQFPNVATYRIPNFVHVSDLPKAEQSLRDPCQLQVVYLGAMTPSKGVETVLAAIDDVCAQYHICFHFIGGEIKGSGYLARFREQAAKLKYADAVRIHGPLPREEAHALAGQCHLFAFPSQWPGEGVPAALIEAMGMGLVPVATRWRGIAEVVQDRENGLLIGSPDPRQLANSILELAEDSTLRQELARAARRTVVASYDAVPALAQWQRIIVEACGT